MRILCWNIKFFSQNRIDFVYRPGRAYNVADENARCAANLSYITTTVREADPDIFVVIEPQVEPGELRKIAGGGGPSGLIFLLGQLQALGAAGTAIDWRLVPPQRMNPKKGGVEGDATKTYTECAGVFWRNDRLDFIGPWRWNGARAKGMTGNGSAYDAPWNNTVPVGNTYAAKTEFYNTNDDSINFTKEFDRRPNLTYFSERTNPPIPPRTIKLYSCHLPPAGRSGSTSRPQRALQKVLQAVIDPGPDQITLAIGDFNVDGYNYYRGAHWLGGPSSYTCVTPPFQFGSRNGSTIIKCSKAKINDYRGQKLLDYAFVKYGTNANPANTMPTLVVADRVTVTAPFTSAMTTSLAVLQNQALTNASNANANFRMRQNYAHIAEPAGDNGTSDHLPVLLTI